MTVEMKYIKYVCSVCGAEDTDKKFPEEVGYAPAINCWKCHAGRGVEVADMISGRRGMFPQFPTVN